MTRLWRSLLYVPTHVDKFVASPRLAEADAVILDLEDSVPADQKVAARDRLAAAVTTVLAAGPSVLVRINDGVVGGADIAAAVQPGVTALVLPKIRSVEQLKRIDERVTTAEIVGGMKPGLTEFVVLIETADGFLAMADILKASPRTVAVNLGAEDFAADVGMVVDEMTLRAPRQHMVIVAAAAGVAPLGLMGVTTRFDDLVAYEQLAQMSKRFGFVGSTCIHPSQIGVLNTAFSPSPEEVVWADRVTAAFAEAVGQGRGAVAIDGRMIDAPVAARAAVLLEKHALVAKRDRSGKGTA